MVTKSKTAQYAFSCFYSLYHYVEFGWCSECTPKECPKMKKDTLKHHPKLKKKKIQSSQVTLPPSGAVKGTPDNGSVPMVPAIHGAMKAYVDTDKAKNHKAEEPLGSGDNGVVKTPSEDKAQKHNEITTKPTTTVSSDLATLVNVAIVKELFFLTAGMRSLPRAR